MGALLSSCAEKPTDAAEGVAAGENRALVFIKPHAVTAAVRELVPKFLAEHGVKVVSQGELTGKDIDSKGVIDDHYAHIAKIAMRAEPSELVVADDKKKDFAAKFGKGEWDALVKDGKVVNLAQYQKKTGKSANEVDKLWLACATFKLAPGTYVGEIEEGLFILNAFYGVMRQVYTDVQAKVVYFVVRFPEAELSWKDFRGKVIGATDPSKATEGSLRAKILAEYADLGLTEEPNMGKNGVHASAGPIEGLRERQVWTGQDVAADPFGQAILGAGVSRAVLDSYLANERVTIDGETDNAYDLLEDKDSSKVIALARKATSKL